VRPNYGSPFIHCIDNVGWVTGKIRTGLMRTVITPTDRLIAVTVITDDFFDESAG